MTTAPDGLPPLGEVIRRHGLAARKGLGQNFILDLNLTRRIARAAGPLDGVTVVEVGPGPGGLTRGLLLEGAGKVVAIERDRRCIPALEEIARRYPDRLEIVEADAVNTDFAALASPPARIVANLPYSAGSELLALWLTAEPWPPWYDRMVLMFQREVAERIVAPSGSRTYGRLSVLAQWRTEARIVLRLPPRAFTPAPKVESALVDLIPRADPEPAGSSAALQQLTAAAFGQRRKMLRSSLKAKIQDPVKLMEKIGIDPSLRAENLSVSQFCALARAWHEEHCGRDGSQL